MPTTVSGGNEAAVKLRKFLGPMLVEEEGEVEAPLRVVLSKVRGSSYSSLDPSLDAFVHTDDETLDAFVGVIVDAAEMDAIEDAELRMTAPERAIYAVVPANRVGRRCLFALLAVTDDAPPLEGALPIEEGYDRLVARYDGLVARYEQAEALRLDQMRASAERADAFGRTVGGMSKQLLPMLLDRLLPHVAAESLPSRLDALLGDILTTPERVGAFVAMLKPHEMESCVAIHEFLISYRAARDAARDAAKAPGAPSPATSERKPTEAGRREEAEQNRRDAAAEPVA